jgi:hypothetical protein
MKKLLTILTAALGLAMSAQARIGWSLDQCQNLWGPPAKVAYNNELGTCYNFRINAKLFAQVYLLNDGAVHSIAYCSKDGKYLVNNVRQLLQKNLSGTWTLYDDGRGKDTFATWQYLAGDTGEMLAYSLLWNYPDKNGFYKLQISTKYWNSYVTSRGEDPNRDSSDSSTLTNI